MFCLFVKMTTISGNDILKIIERRSNLKQKGFINRSLSDLLKDYDVNSVDDLLDREINLLTLIFNDYSHCHTAFLSYVHAHMNARQTLIDLRNSSTSEASAFKDQAKETYQKLQSDDSPPLFPVLFSELGKDSVFMRQFHMTEMAEKLSLGTDTTKFDEWDKVVVQENTRVADMFREALKKTTRLSEENRRLREENKRLTTLQEEGREDALERIIDERVATNLRRLLAKDEKTGGKSSASKSGSGTGPGADTDGTIVGIGGLKGLAEVELEVHMEKESDRNELEKKQIEAALNTLGNLDNNTDVDQFIYEQTK